MKTMLARLQTFLQVQISTVSFAERLISVAGSFLGIFLIMVISITVLDPGSAVLIIASMGASAVLLFAVPHSVLSQPWPLLGGQMISALIGVACAMFIPSPLIAGAAAVSLAIGAMHVLRCIHPPGGATALAAVIGGEAVHSLGFQFILTPVLLNVLVILAVAVVFNFPFPWRRYPVGWVRLPSAAEDHGEPYSDISHADFVAALSQIDSFIDVTEQDLLLIYDLVTSAGNHRPRKP